LKPEPSSGISIEVNALAKRFNRDWIFRKLSYSFHPSQTYAITGPNGSGKSTLLHVLWGQSPPSNGTIVYKSGDKTLAVEDFYHHVAIATPYMDLIDEFTLVEQVAFHFKLKTPRHPVSTETIIERMGLQNSRHKQIGNFSSGMRQRVKLSLAFSTKADIVFLDEPGTNLDKNAFQWYLDYLSEIQSDTMVFIASNDQAEYLTAHHTLNILDFK
jgi:ABC-type multidrug transport system ATPase subunit